jgi:predicted transposase YbfD/YdcC
MNLCVTIRAKTESIQVLCFVPGTSMTLTQCKAEQAFDQVVDWLDHFEELDDPRQSGKVAYPLDEMLLQCLLAVLAGADSWVEVAAFGRKKLDFLRRFLAFSNGTPSHDQFGNLFAALDTEGFQKCFIAWVASVSKLGPEVVAIDGKTLRRSYQEGGAKAPIHMISAFASRQNLVLGQIKVAEKSNEITAIPQLLDLLTLKGAIVTIDAMGCQKEIARKIIAKAADYVLALKGNQGSLSEDVVLFFDDQKASKYKDSAVSREQTVEKSHGRIETRTYTSIDAIDWLKERHDWVGLKSIVMVESVREFVGGKTESETRYFISSMAADAARQGHAVRGHWGVEAHHWIMDMVFRDDECRIRRENAPANFAIIKHIASNLLRKAPGKQSMRLKRHLAAWDETYLASLISGTG